MFIKFHFHILEIKILSIISHFSCFSSSSVLEKETHLYMQSLKGSPKTLVQIRATGHERKKYILKNKESSLMRIQCPHL